MTLKITGEKRIINERGLGKLKDNKYRMINMNTLIGKFEQNGMIRKSKRKEEKQTEVREEK